MLKKLKVLMFGWEFPPHNQGGLGTACEGFVKGLTNQDAKVTMVLPRHQETNIEWCKIVSPNFKLVPVNSSLQAYHTSESYCNYFGKSANSLYGENLLTEVHRYATAVEFLVKEFNEEFDVIHAHDWLTYLAGVKAKEILGIPLVVHIHSTEFDRTGGSSVNSEVFDIETYGMKAADKVIAVSNFTKNKVIDYYGINPEKIEVVHNAVEFNNHNFHSEKDKNNNPLVLFLGRITLQKGPDYFLKAAKKVLQYNENVTFVYAGNGDMMERMINDVAQAGLGDKILFTGFLRGREVDRMYQKADLYVMPSVSEPFGITPLEAMRNNIPTIISKQSGVSEVVSHCMKVDFWDIDEMANKIIAVIEHKPLASCLSQNANKEVHKFNWNKPAKKCLNIYNDLLGCTG